MTLIEYDNLQNYKIISKIGEGVYSTVYRVENIHSHKVFALKVLKMKYQTIEEISKNEEILSMLQTGTHPNVVQLHKVIYEPEKSRLSLLIDLMQKNAYELIKEYKGGMPETLALYLLYQILSGLKHIHSKGLIHRDMKQENCFVNSDNMELKIGDFGSASMLVKEKELTEYIATRWYRAPECILTRGKYDFKMDTWAAGCMFYEFLTGRPLFPGKNSIDQINKIDKILGTPDEETLRKFTAPEKFNNFNFIKYPKAKWSQLLPKVQNTQIYDLLEKLLAYFPANRITATEAMKHPAFNVLKNLPMDENGNPIFKENKIVNDQKNNIEFIRAGRMLRTDIPKGSPSFMKKPRLPCTPPKEGKIKSQITFKPRTNNITFQLPKTTVKFGEKIQ